MAPLSSTWAGGSISPISIPPGTSTGGAGGALVSAGVSSIEVGLELGVPRVVGSSSVFSAISPDEST